MYREVEMRQIAKACRLFPLNNVCGCWVCQGFPAIRIFKQGSRYRLTYSYDRNTAFTVPVTQHRQETFFFLYGRIHLSYDDERDVLLTDEGAYTRAEDGH